MIYLQMKICSKKLKSRKMFNNNYNNKISINKFNSSNNNCLNHYSLIKISHNCL